MRRSPLPWGEGSVQVIGTPKPDITLIILARFGPLFADVDSLVEEKRADSDAGCDLSCTRPKWGPVKRVGKVGDIRGGGVSPRKSWMFFRFCERFFLCRNNPFSGIAVPSRWNVHFCSRLDSDKGLAAVEQIKIHTCRVRK